jgi:hypothetical protein
LINEIDSLVDLRRKLHPGRYPRRANRTSCQA